MKKSRISGKSGLGKGNNSDASPEDLDDLALWQYVTRNIRPISKKNPAPRQKKPAAAASPAAKPAAPKTPSPKIPALKSATPPVSIGRLAPPKATAAKAPKPTPAKPSTLGFDKATETKLRKGHLDIEARIDLHGMTQGEAYAALGRFIRASVAAERRTLLVITGKGRLGGGVLRRSLPLWLEDNSFGSSVLAITPAAPKDGGDGAFYIRLRKPKG